jgi:hypothetical protein
MEYSIKKLVEYFVFLLLYCVSVIYDRTVLVYEGTIVELSVPRQRMNFISDIHMFVYYYLIDNMKLKIVQLRMLSVVFCII